MSRPMPGSKAPMLSAIAVGGDFPAPTEIRLRDFIGESVVLYFYPKDDTPGCTKQACALRDGWNQIRDRARLFGVSTDSVASHQKFIAKHRLPFPLLSDEERRMVVDYGVWVEKRLYGRTYMGIERTTFVIGPDGVIKAVLPGVKPEAHLDRLLAEL